MLKRIENLRLMAKMAFPIAVMLMAALGIVAFAERALFRLTDETHEIIRVTAARQALALSASASVNGIAADEKNAMLMTDKAGLDIFASGYVTEIDRLKQDIAGLKRLTTEAAETERLDRIAGAIHDTMRPASSSTNSWSPGNSIRRMHCRWAPPRPRASA
jgi:hypothetical protein